MNKIKVISLVKKLTAGALAVGMIVLGIAIYPKQAEAAVKDKVIYEEYQAEDIAANYWTATKKTAPVKEGYVFGGWFTEVEGNKITDKTEKDDESNKYYDPLTEVTEDAYAKFVPAQVLSVKAQNESTVTEDYIKNFTNEEDSFYVRVVTSLDSSNYQKVGFDIYLGNWKKVYKEGTTDGATETSRIYTGLMQGDNPISANQIFGGESEYLGVWQLSKIDHKENVSLIIYVRPYWVTSDGTKVNGLAKYVHIEDEYLGYINVPVNLLGGEKVAAGAVNLTYSSQSNKTLELVGFEKGRIFTEMIHSYNGKSVKMLGTTKLDVDQYQEAGETIYANLRFKKPIENTDFNIVDEDNQFCDWDETIVDVKKVWDTKYVP